MTTTPTIWKHITTVNAGSTAGLQTVQQTIGLANGNILVVWEDTTNGPSPLTDIMGQTFDPEGVAIGAPFQVNAGVTAFHETGPKIVALPDGGYVVAYGSWSEADGGFIVVQRFNSLDQAVSERFITDDGGALLAWEITADRKGNYTVTFDIDIGDDIDIHSITYNNDPELGPINAPRQERTNVAQNTEHNDRLAATAALSNGHVVTFYTEPDYTIIGDESWTAEFTITDPQTGAVVRSPVEIQTDESFVDQITAKDVAVLTGDQIVFVYDFASHDDSGYYFKVCLGGALNSSIGPRVLIPTAGDRSNVGGAHVVAMQDGGFFIAWLETDSHTLYGQRYGTYGDAIGARFAFAEDVNSFAASRLSLTFDGRILVPYRNTAGEISKVILDPRDNIINGTDAGEVITTQIGSTQIQGLGGNDKLLGQGGNDRLDGGADNDTLDGGAGNDTYILSDLALKYIFFDTLEVIIGYDYVIEAAGGGIDTVLVRRVSSTDSNEHGGYALTDNVENARVAGTEIFNLTGNALANVLTGNGAANILVGLAGNDTLAGGPGNDVLNGGGGSDKLFGGPGGDKLTGGAAGDFLSGAGGNDTLYGGAGADRLAGHAGGDDLFGGGDKDVMAGGDGDDRLFGGNGNDRLNGEGGNDALAGDAGADALYGGDGNDRLFGGAGNDRLFGGASNDRLRGDDGNDLLTGGGGRDQFLVQPGGDSDTVADFQNNFDFLDFRLFGFAGKPAVLNLASQVGADVVFNLGGGDTVRLSFFDIALLGGEDILI